jgi:hypothetical protein
MGTYTIPPPRPNMAKTKEAIAIMMATTAYNIAFYFLMLA